MSLSFKLPHAYLNNTPQGGSDDFGHSSHNRSDERPLHLVRFRSFHEKLGTIPYLQGSAEGFHRANEERARERRFADDVRGGIVDRAQELPGQSVRNLFL